MGLAERVEVGVGYNLKSTIRGGLTEKVTSEPEVLPQYQAI